MSLPSFLSSERISVAGDLRVAVSRDRVWVELCVDMGGLFYCSMTRQEDGKFKDEQLAQIIFEA